MKLFSLVMGFRWRKLRYVLGILIPEHTDYLKLFRAFLLEYSNLVRYNPKNSGITLNFWTKPKKSGYLGNILNILDPNIIMYYPRITYKPKHMRCLKFSLKAHHQFYTFFIESDREYKKAEKIYSGFHLGFMYITERRVSTFALYLTHFDRRCMSI